MSTKKADYITVEYQALVDAPVPSVRIYKASNDGSPIEFPLAFFEEHPDLERSVFFVDHDYLFLASHCTLRLFASYRSCPVSHGCGYPQSCQKCAENCVRLLSMSSRRGITLSMLLEHISNPEWRLKEFLTELLNQRLIFRITRLTMKRYISCLT